MGNMRASSSHDSQEMQECLLPRFGFEKKRGSNDTLENEDDNERIEHDLSGLNVLFFEEAAIQTHLPTIEHDPTAYFSTYGNGTENASRDEKHEMSMSGTPHHISILSDYLDEGNMDNGEVVRKEGSKDRLL